MRIKAAGAHLTVGELCELLTEVEAHGDAEMSFVDFGPVVAAEAGPLSVTFEATEYPIDRDEQAQDHAEFVEQVAAGTIETLEAIRERAKELDY
jgi:hypothetical protein